MGLLGRQGERQREAYSHEAGEANRDPALVSRAMSGLAGGHVSLWCLGDFLGVTLEVCKLCVCRWEHLPLCPLLLRREEH